MKKWVPSSKTTASNEHAYVTHQCSGQSNVTIEQVHLPTWKHAKEQELLTVTWTDYLTYTKPLCSLIHNLEPQSQDYFASHLPPAKEHKATLHSLFFMSHKMSFCLFLTTTRSSLDTFISPLAHIHKPYFACCFFLTKSSENPRESKCNWDMG